MAGVHDRIRPQAWMTATATRRVMDAFASAGVEARFVGGCVRDALLDRPVSDIDIASPALPEEATRILTAADIAVHPTGVRHGTVTAVADHRPFEITTLRRDVETFGRHARVEFTDDWQADAARRDFTMNAIFCGADGALFDFFDGIADARAGRVRFVGDPVDRLREDVLRLLRLFRFQAHYGRVPPDAAALAAARLMAPELPTLSGERVRNETLRLLTAPDPMPVLGLMRDCDVLTHYFTEATGFDRLSALIAIEAALPDGLSGPADAIRRLAALIGGGRAPAQAVATRFRLSNDDRDRLLALAAFDPVPPVLTDRERRRRLHREGAACFRDRALLSWADDVAAGRVMAGKDAEAWHGHLRASADWSAMTLPIKGADALAMGVSAGPAVGRLVAAVEAWWIEGDFHADRDACLAKLKELAAGDGG
jgi:poly(A) polymerase